MYVASAPSVSGFPSYIQRDNADKGRRGVSRSIFNKRSVPGIRIQSSVLRGKAIALLERTLKENVGVT